MSRPTKYRPEYVDQLQGLCEDPKQSFGAFREIAGYLGVSVQSVRNWCSRYPDFAASVKDFQDLGAEYAEESLFFLARGPTTVKTIQRPNGDTIVETTRGPPDYRALRLILVNRRPNEWKDKTDVALSGEGLTPIIVFGDEELTPERKRTIEMKNNGRQIIQFDKQDAGLL